MSRIESQPVPNSSLYTSATTKETQNLKPKHFTESVPYAGMFAKYVRCGMLTVPEVEKIDSKTGNSQVKYELPESLTKGFHRWQHVRKGIFNNGTGFEGYVDTSRVPLEEGLLQIGDDFLDMLKRAYPLDYGKRRRFLNALIQDQFDGEAMRFWNEVLGAELSMLRVRVLKSQSLKDFRTKTDLAVCSLPAPVISRVGYSVLQEYDIIPNINPTDVKMPDKESAHIVRTIGKLCAPTSRLLVSALY